MEGERQKKMKKPLHQVHFWTCERKFCLISFFTVLALIPTSYENILLTKLIAETLECNTRESAGRDTKGQTDSVTKLRLYNLKHLF